jgi:hypothetical protein
VCQLEVSLASAAGPLLPFFLREAQYFFMRSAAALRAASDMGFLLFLGLVLPKTLRMDFRSVSSSLKRLLRVS